MNEAPQDPRVGNVFVARQPIFNSELRLVGYELLYRANASENRAVGATQERMSADVLVNSAAIGGRGIESIRHAVRIVGRDMLYRWMGMLLLSSTVQQTGAAWEAVDVAVQRARLCEHIAVSRGKEAEEGPLFMVGLFSLLDTIVQVPMEEILAHLSVSAEIRDALLTHEGPYAPPLKLVEAYERGEWDEISRISPAAGVSPARAAQLYLESAQWADEWSGLARA